MLQISMINTIIQHNRETVDYFNIYFHPSKISTSLDMWLIIFKIIISYLIYSLIILY